MQRCPLPACSPKTEGPGVVPSLTPSWWPGQGDAYLPWEAWKGLLLPESPGIVSQELWHRFPACLQLLLLQTRRGPELGRERGLGLGRLPHFASSKLPVPVPLG